MKTKASFSAPLFILIIYAMVFASRFVQDKLLESGGNIFLSVIILQILIFILPSMIFCRLKGVGYSMKLNIKPFSLMKFGSIIMSSLTLICFSILIRFAQIYVFGVKSFSFSIYDSYLAYAGENSFLYVAMAFVVMPAIAETFVFRSILLTEYNEEGTGEISVSIISSLLYGMMFFSLELLPVFFFAGLLYCLVTYATGSSLAALFAQLIFNIYGIFGEKYIIKVIENPSNKIVCFFAATLLFLILSVITLGEFEHMMRRMGQNGTPTPSYRLKKSEDGETPDITATEASEEGSEAKVIGSNAKLRIEAFFSPTFILCILVFAVAVFGLS